jgi:hypothetical protein
VGGILKAIQVVGYLLAVLMIANWTANSQASGQPVCIDQAQAQSTMLVQLEDLRKKLHQETGFWVPRQKFREAISRTDWLPSHQIFISGLILGWDCAAGASCYVNLAVKCSGEVFFFHSGD